jgi:hypothetical protein
MNLFLGTRGKRIYFAAFALLAAAYLILATGSSGRSQLSASQEAQAAGSCPGELMEVQSTGERESRPVPEAVINGEPWGGTYWPAGTRSYWHCHSGGQLLVVWEGEGLIQRRGERVRRLAVGESDLAAPWEEHWHGGAPETGALYVGVVLQPTGTLWMEEVGRDDYLGNDVGINSRNEFLRTGIREKARSP